MNGTARAAAMLIEYEQQMTVVRAMSPNIAAKAAGCEPWWAWTVWLALGIMAVNWRYVLEAISERSKRT